MNTFKTTVAAAFLTTMSSTVMAISYDHSSVTLTNNTADTINVNAKLLTDDPTFEKGSDWNVLVDHLEPYESREVLWFARDTGIREGSHYRFILSASNEAFASSPVETQFDVRQKQFFGSYVTSTLRVPGDDERSVFKNDGLQHFDEHFWGSDYKVHVRTWRPKAHIFNNFHVVIDKPEAKTVQTLSDNDISVLTYNTQLMPFYTGVVNDLNQPDVRVHDIPKKITEYDVVIMEELFDGKLRSKMYNDMKAVYPYHTRVVGEGADLPLTGGVVIFSKWPIEKEDQIVYTDSTGVDELAAKGAGYARINKNGKIYHIFGTHTDAGGDAATKRARLSELKEMKNLIDRQGIPANEPVLIGGDMNVNEFSDELPVMLSTLNASMPVNTGFKYSADAVTDTMNNGHDRGRLDYVLYSNEHAKPKQSMNHVYILRALDHEKMWPKFDLSDHFPVSSYFSF